jgi:hypothetical protein
MSVLISDAFALAPGGIPLNTPILGWSSILPARATIAASSEAAGFPAANLTNSSTAQRWAAGAPGSPPADVFLTITVDPEFSDPIDYLAIAVHNLGTGQNTVSVESSDLGSPVVWDELVEEAIPADDEPIVFRWAPQSLAALRLRIQPSPLEEPTTPFVAVLFAGKLLVLPRGTHTDHVPINRATTARVLSGKSETGNFLGRWVLSEERATNFALQHLEPAFYDELMAPFIDAARETPFFFAWQPQKRPREVGYCWMTNDPQPTDQFGVRRKAISLQLGGIAV